MKLVKPVWVSHSGKHIYSIHIHPDGTRFATCGHDEKIKVWSTKALKDISKEKNQKTNKLLCTISNHTGSVNCVRFSDDGKLLASGGDDKVVMVYEWRKYSYTC